MESYLRHQGSSFVDRFDANSYLYITRALDYFDLAAGHEGVLANAFLRAYEDFDRQFGVVQQQLENIHSKLVDTQMNYSRNEEEQQAASNAITSLLNG